MRDLAYSVADIVGRPGEYRDFRVEGSLAGDGTALARLADAPVRADLRAESVVEGVLVTGSVRADATLECARCLTRIDATVPVDDLCDLYVAPGHEAPEGEDAYELAGLEIDLEPMLRDSLLLALPLNPLCRAGCRGLCARCGRDLNTGACGCVDDDPDPRWAALEGLRARLEKTEG